MTSTNKKVFTFQDFEKGLMLAGYITPKDASEVHEKNCLDEYEKTNSQIKKSQYFNRVVLAAEIVNELKNEKTFGRVKFQKMVYLCENVVHMNLTDDRYKKFAAGPFDNRFMHSIDKEFKKQNWFDVEIIKDGKYQKPQYIELENKDKYKEYYNNYFGKFDEAIKRVLSLMKTQKTDFVELIATIFFCWKEIIDEKQNFENTLIYDKVHSWAKEKEKYSNDDIDIAIKWMEENKITPKTI